MKLYVTACHDRLTREYFFTGIHLTLNGAMTYLDKRYALDKELWQEKLIGDAWEISEPTWTYTIERLPLFGR